MELETAKVPVAAVVGAGVSSSNSGGGAGASMTVESIAGMASPDSSRRQARVVELVPGGPAVLLLTGLAAASVIVSQWVT